MDKYSVKYMETHCIDVFFACGPYPIHILTACSIIPDALNDILRNRTLQEEIERNEGGAAVSAISSNGDYIKSLIEKHRSVIAEYRQKLQSNELIEYFPNPDVEQIISHFRYYANQGFYSYDCCEVKDEGTAVYRLMAWPDKTLQLNYNLPQFEPNGFVVSSNLPPIPEFIEI